MNKLILQICIRQIIDNADRKIFIHNNESIIKEYRESIRNIRLQINRDVRNRRERAILLAFLDKNASCLFSIGCFHDAFYLRERLKELRRNIPPLV